MEEKNKMNSSIDDIDIFIKEIVKKHNNSSLKIIGKRLSYIKNTIIFQFYLTIYRSSKINPFDTDICLLAEFCENNQPYVRIISDFINPSLNDGRNIFCCLTNKHNYIFNRYNLNICEKIIDELISGIGNFLLCLKENLDINVFIYYGEYEIGHIYQINDLLFNYSRNKFYRINVINGKNEEMKYIVITQLFFLLFTPEKDDMSFAKLENFFYLKDIQFSFDIIKANKRYNLSISNVNSNEKIYNTDFCFTQNISDVNKIVNNNMYDKKYEEFKDSLNKRIDLKKYKLVITNYKPLFTFDVSTINKSRSLVESYMYNDYKLYVKYFEELIQFYKNSKDESTKKRVKTFYDYLNYCCVDFISLNSSNTEEAKFYQSKIIQYSKK